MGQRVVVDLVLDEQLEQAREALVRQEHGDDGVSIRRDVAGRRRDPSEPVLDRLPKSAQIMVLLAQARYLIRLAREVLLVCDPFAELARALGGFLAPPRRELSVACGALLLLARVALLLLGVA